MHETDAPSFDQRMQRIEQLVQRIEDSSDHAAQDAAREMVRTLLDLHAEALTRMLQLVEPVDDCRSRVLDAWQGDALVRSVLLLHDLHPQGTESRVRQALDRVRPYLDSHGGGVELLEAGRGVVRLRLEGNCQGCPSSTATMKQLIEAAIYDAAPEVEMIEVDGLDSPVPTGPLVQLQPPAR